jgi:hypothetical protein
MNSDAIKGFFFGGSPIAALGGGIEGSASYLFPILAIIIGLLMVAMLIYVAVQYAKNRPTTTMTGPTDLFAPKNPVVVDRTTVRGQMSATYTLSLFLKIDAVPDSRLANTPILMLPGVMTLSYRPAQETLEFLYVSSSGIAPETLEIPGFSLQRWNQLTITLEGRTLDVYVNGKITQSALLGNVPPSGNSSITIMPDNVIGSAALAQVWPRRLTVAEVAANYASTSDSQGRPFLGNTLLAPLKAFEMPSLMCAGGNCDTAAPTATPSQTWEFPYA